MRKGAVVLLLALGLFGLPSPSWAVFVSVTFRDGDTQRSFQQGAVTAGNQNLVIPTNTQVGDFLLTQINAALPATVQGIEGVGSADKLTLTNIIIKNTSNTTQNLAIDLSGIFNAVATTATQFWGTSVSGTFTDVIPTQAASGDRIQMVSRGGWDIPCVELGCPADPSILIGNPISYTVGALLTQNRFGPQNPTQQTANNTCSNVNDGNCGTVATTISTSATITLAAGDQLSLPGSITLFQADNQAFIDTALASVVNEPDPNAVANPSTLLLLGSGLVGLIVRRRRRR